MITAFLLWVAVVVWGLIEGTRIVVRAAVRLIRYYTERHST